MKLNSNSMETNMKQKKTLISILTIMFFIGTLPFIMNCGDEKEKKDKDKKEQVNSVDDINKQISDLNKKIGEIRKEQNKIREEMNNDKENKELKEKFNKINKEYNELIKSRNELHSKKRKLEEEAIEYVDSEIKFETPTYKFEPVVEGEKVEYAFKFKNPSEYPLKLVKVKPACGCTAADYPKDFVKPGGEGQIKSILKTRGYSGKIKKTISITTNSKKQKNVTLAFEGEVIPLVEFPRSVDLKEIVPGKDIVETVSIKVPEKIKETTKVTEIKPIKDYIKAELITVKEGKEYKIKATIDTKEAHKQLTKQQEDIKKRNPKYKGQDPLRFYGYINVKTDNPKKKSFNISFRGAFKSNSKANPQ